MWNAPSSLSKIYALASDYPDCSSLFCNRLKLKNATINHVVEEIFSLDNLGLIDRGKELLITLSDYLLKGASHSAVFKLKGKRVIPAYSKYEKVEDAKFIFLAYDLHVFYLVDRSSLAEASRGKSGWLTSPSTKSIDCLPLSRQ